MFRARAESEPLCTLGQDEPAHKQGLYAQSRAMSAAWGETVSGVVPVGCVSGQAQAAREGRHVEERQESETGAGSGILRVFGQQLKLCRMRAGLERPELGAQSGYSASTIASFEQGRRIPPPRNEALL